MRTLVWPLLTARPPVPATRSGPAYRMYRSILGAHASILMILALFTTLAWVGKLDLQAPTVPLRVLIALVLVGTAAAVLRSGERLALLGLLCLNFLVVTPMLGEATVPNDSTVGMALSAVGLMAARLLPLAWAMALLIVLSGVHVATLEMIGMPTSGLSLDAMVLSLSTVVAAVTFVNAMQSSAIETERVSVANRRRELALSGEQAQGRVRDGIRRVLHDDVLGTLHLIADPLAPVDRIRAQCRATITAIGTVVDEAPPAEVHEVHQPGVGVVTTSYDLLLREVEAQSPIPVDVVVARGAQGLPELTTPQHRALRRALGEGVRNAIRHGGVDRVTLRISAGRRAVRLEILDRGRGVDGSYRSGFGLVESVERPLAELGGTCALLPRPGGGAVLALTVPREPDNGGRLHHAYGLTTGGLGAVQQLPRAVALPIALAWTVIGLHSVLKEPSSWLTLAVGVGWLVLALVVVRQSERGSPGAAWVMGVVAVSLALQVIGIAMLPPGAMLDFRSWSIGMSALPLVVLVLSLPLTVGVAIVTSHVIVVLVAPLVRPELTGGLMPWGSLNAVITSPVPTMVLGSLIRRQGRALAEQHRREFALEHGRMLEEHHRSLTDLYFAHVRTEVLPWLESVARGDLDPRDQATRERARLLAVAARDDLYAPGFFDESLRADVSHFRARGGTVDLRPGLLPGGHERAVGHLLRGLLPISAGRRIIISPPLGANQPVRVSVLPPPHDGDLERLRTGGTRDFEWDSDAYRAVLLVEDLPVSGDRHRRRGDVFTPHDD